MFCRQSSFQQYTEWVFLSTLCYSEHSSKYFERVSGDEKSRKQWVRTVVVASVNPGSSCLCVCSRGPEDTRTGSSKDQRHVPKYFSGWVRLLVKCFDPTSGGICYTLKYFSKTALPFKRKVSTAHQGCCYLIKNIGKPVIVWNINTIELK